MTWEELSQQQRGLLIILYYQGKVSISNVFIQPKELIPIYNALLVMAVGREIHLLDAGAEFVKQNKEKFL